MNAIFRNPYFPCGAQIARLSVCAATMIWALIVIYQDNALLPTSYGSLLTHLMPENVYGWAALLISGTLLFRILREFPPHWFGILGYGLMMVSWGFVDAVLWLTRPWQPTAIAWVTPGTVLAIFAFVSNRWRTGCGHDSGA